MKISIVSFFVLISLLAFGQNPKVDELGKIYLSGDLDQTILKANEFLINDPNNIDYKLILGRALTDKGKGKEAVPHLNYTVVNDRNNSWRKAWALGYLGTCYFMEQKYDESEKMFNDCINLNATRNATNYALGNSSLFGLNEFYKNWKIIEAENFRFHFQNMNGSEIEKFISKRETAFNEINKFFESEVPKKIDFYVWENRDDARKILRKNLGFANPDFCIIHAHYQQTVGHEMTHVISNYTSEISHKTRFVNEGTSVCFDLSNQDRLKDIREWIAKNNKQIEIKDYWENGENYAEEILYPLSGLFIKELIDNFGKEKFLTFFKNQTFENAKLVFGDKLDKVIKDFENKINT